LINIGHYLGLWFSFICIYPGQNLIKTPIANNKNKMLLPPRCRKIANNSRIFFYFFSFFLFDKIAKKGHFIGLFVDFSGEFLFLCI
jgi:hypothetical protein